MFTYSNAFSPVERLIPQTIQLDNPSVISVVHTYPVKMPHPRANLPPVLILVLHSPSHAIKRVRMPITHHPHPHPLHYPPRHSSVLHSYWDQQWSYGPHQRPQSQPSRQQSPDPSTRPCSADSGGCSVASGRNAACRCCADGRGSRGWSSVGPASRQSISPHSPFCTCPPSHTFEHREQR